MTTVLLIAGDQSTSAIGTPAFVLSEFLDGPFRTLDLSVELLRLGAYGSVRRGPLMLTPDDVYAAFAQGAVEAFLHHQSRASESSFSSLTLESRQPDEASVAHLATARYLLRRDVRQPVYAMAAGALVAEHDQHGNPVWLFGDNVGSAIALDLATGEYRSAVAGLVTLGSPLGGLASVPSIGGNLVAAKLRAVSVPWLDVRGDGDSATRWPIGPQTGFVPGPTRTLVVETQESEFAGYFRQPMFGQWANQFKALAERAMDSEFG